MQACAGSHACSNTHFFKIRIQTHLYSARGVKLVGATAHYATETLDEGPIIEQDVDRISHRHSVDDLLAKGRVLEREVLVRAVKAHLEDRIIVYDNKCVVFGS